MGCNPACNLSSTSLPLYTPSLTHLASPSPLLPALGGVRDKWTLPRDAVSIPHLPHFQALCVTRRPPPACGISPTPPTLAGIVRDKADPPGMRDQVIGLFEEWLRLLPTGPDDKVGGSGGEEGVEGEVSTRVGGVATPAAHRA